MKGLINVKNNDNECFIWCHIRHLNLVKTDPERVTKEDKMINDLDYEGIEFPFSKKDYCKVALMCSVMKINWLIPFIYQSKSFIILWICC